MPNAAHHTAGPSLTRCPRNLTMHNAAYHTAGLMGKTPVVRPPPQSGGGLADMDADAKDLGGDDDFV